MIKRILLTLIALCGIYVVPSKGQAIIAGQPCGAPGVSAIATNGQAVLCQGSPLVWTATGGSGPGGGVGATTNSAAPITAYYFTNQCQVANTGQCFFTSANTQLVNDCNWASTGPTVTCASSHFVSSDVGKRVAGYVMNGVPNNISGCVAGRTSFTALTTASVTIQTFTSGTQISLSSNPANTTGANNGCFVWGTPDDSNASTFETAYDAITTFCPKIMFAAAGYWFSNPHFASQPTGCAALPSVVGAGAAFGNMVYTAGLELEGRGPGNTVFHMGPDFPAAGGNLCTNSQGNITNACWLVPVEGKMSDIQFSGDGQLTCQVSTKTLLGVTVGTLQNVTLTNFCQAPAGRNIGIGADFLAQLYQVNSSGWGGICLQTTVGTAGAQAFKLGCENSGGLNTGDINGSLDIQAGAAGNPTFTCWGCQLLGSIASPGGLNVVGIASGATVYLYNSTIENCESGANCTTTGTVLVRNSGGKLYLNGVVEFPNGGVTGISGLGCGVANGITYVENTHLASNGTGQNYFDTAGCTLYDLGGNDALFTGVSASMQGTVVADGRSAMFSCTGVANASVTNSLYGTGPNVTSTTCAGQTATLGAGIPFQQARNITGVICTSSATTVSVACTVMKNGATTTTTCTMTAATRCINFTSNAVNPGDLLSAEIVTGAAETGANIHMQVLWQ